MIAEALLLVTGSGALAFWLGVLAGRSARTQSTEGAGSEAADVFV